MQSDNSILFDTNILIYNQDRKSKFYDLASQYHDKVLDGKLQGVIASQNILEFSAVMMNKKIISKPLSQKMVSGEIQKYINSGTFTFIYPTNETHAIYLNLLKKYQLKNPHQVFDLYLVATMLSSKVHVILTANGKDFQFEEISVIQL